MYRTGFHSKCESRTSLSRRYFLTSVICVAAVLLVVIMLASSTRLARRAPSRRLQSRAPSVRVHAMGLFDGIAKALGMSTSAGCQLAPATAPAGLELATFAGGCFWGLELAYQRVPGVVSTSSGYTGGHKANPTYEAVCMGMTGHTEAVQVTYNPEDVTYDALLDEFFLRVDPTTLNRQGNDAGTQYRSGIYYHNDAQKEAAAKKIAEVNDKLAKGEKVRERPYEGTTVVAELKAAGDYYIAEDYHQQYLAKGGRNGRAQSAEKGCKDQIRCYG